MLCIVADPTYRFRVGCKELLASDQSSPKSLIKHGGRYRTAYVEEERKEEYKCCFSDNWVPSPGHDCGSMHPSCSWPG